MIRFLDVDGKSRVIVNCGCCKINFSAVPGGNAFCTYCLNGQHLDCNVLYIMGKSRA